jgi:hypothetical protein
MSTMKEYEPNFIDDEEKMIDFKTLTKDEFLFSYSYLSEEEYYNTKLTLQELNLKSDVAELKTFDELTLAEQQLIKNNLSKLFTFEAIEHDNKEYFLFYKEIDSTTEQLYIYVVNI